MKLEIDCLFPRNHVIMEYLLFNKLDYHYEVIIVVVSVESEVKHETFGGKNDFYGMF